MRFVPLPPPRAVALLQVAFLALPLVVLEHQHDAGHDGETAHFETDHGGHFVGAPELGPRVSASPQSVVPAVVPAPAGGVPAPLIANPVAHEGPGTLQAARPPPGGHLSRAPPVRS